MTILAYPVPARNPSPAPTSADFFEITSIVHHYGRTVGKHAQRMGDAVFHSITVQYTDCEGSARELFTGYDPSSRALAKMHAAHEMHQWLTRCNGWAALEAYEAGQ